MTKKCVLCEKEAELQIKDISDFYCKECANEQFSDITLLIKVENDAKKLKKYIEESLSDNKGE